MTTPGSGRDRAIEAAARALAIVRAHGLWDKLNEDEQAVVLKATRGQAALVLDHAVPVLLNDLADSIEARRSPNVEGSAIGLGHNMAIDEIASLVRAAAAGWGEA